MTTLDPRDEIEWFVDLAFWVAPRLADPSFDGFVSWCSRWVDVSGFDALRRRLLLDEPARIEAERALVALLGTMQSRHTDRRLQAFPLPERDVDWATTLIAAGGRAPERYLAMKAIRGPHGALERGLRGAALRWARELADLGLTAAHAQRSAELLRVAGRGRGATVMPVATMLRQLSSLGPEGITLARAWRRTAIGQLRLDSKSEEARRNLASLGSDLVGDADNINDLLELTARLEVLRAAIGTGWNLLEAIEQVRPGKPAIELERDGLRLSLTKGRPMSPATRTEVRDRLGDAVEIAGLVHRGNQPDIVLSFWRPEAPLACALVLADAKRNASDDGRRYLSDALDAAATYAMSYGAALRLEPGITITGPIDPAITLFCRQTPARALGDASQAVARLDDDRTLPFALALSFDRHFGPAAPRSADGHTSDVMSAWLRRVERKVRVVLGLTNLARTRRRRTARTAELADSGQAVAAE